MRPGILDYIEAESHGITGHDFLTVGPCIDMTVFTYLITHIPHIDLQYFQLFRTQWKLPDVRDLILKIREFACGEKNDCLLLLFTAY